jgi:hypothetical protein
VRHDAIDEYSSVFQSHVEAWRGTNIVFGVSDMLSVIVTTRMLVASCNNSINRWGLRIPRCGTITKKSPVSQSVLRRISE